MKNIQLYSLATPNGQKVSIALEEMELEYDAHLINIMKNEQFTNEFIAINPNSKIPAITDLNGPGNMPINIMESGAILLYLAEKTGLLLSKNARERSETIQWLFFQMGGVGPMFGQFGHFYKYAKDKCDHPYPVERYSTEVKRLLKVLDSRLAINKYIVGDHLSIADISIFPWVSALDQFYNASEFLGLNKDYPHLKEWLEVCLARPKVKIGMNVCNNF